MSETERMELVIKLEMKRTPGGSLCILHVPTCCGIALYSLGNLQCWWRYQNNPCTTVTPVPAKFEVGYLFLTATSRHTRSTAVAVRHNDAGRAVLVENIDIENDEDNVQETTPVGRRTGFAKSTCSTVKDVGQIF